MTWLNSVIFSHPWWTGHMVNVDSLPAVNFHLIKLYSFVHVKLCTGILKRLNAKYVYFNGDLNDLMRGIENMLSKEKAQIKICTDLEQYQEGAWLVLELKEEYGLSGDFSDIERIAAAVTWNSQKYP